MSEPENNFSYKLNSKAEYWKGILPGLFGDYNYFVTETTHTKKEFIDAVSLCEEEKCRAIVLIPMAYTSSGAAVPVLSNTKLPLIVVSTSRDAPLPYTMEGDHLLANQAMHGVQDVCNGLWRQGKPHAVISGHLSQELFARRFQKVLRAADGAWVLKYGKIGQLGGFFPDMLDFTFDDNLQNKFFGYKKIEINTAF